MLSACGGGDGAGTASFTSWSSIQPSSTVVAQGLSQEYAYDPATGRVIRTPLLSTSSSVTVTFDVDRRLSNLVLRTPTTTVDLDSFVNRGGGSQGFLEATSSADLTTTAVIADFRLFGYEYQTFGVWETPSTSINNIGTFSAGALTPATGIPTTNGVTFTGNLAGVYVDQFGERFFAFGTVDLVANFAGPTRTLEFSTSHTILRSDLVHVGNELDGADLDLRGTLTYVSGTNSFSGTVAPSGSGSRPLSGSSTGQFYGPSAQELGGVFSLRNLSDSTSPETYSGAYGAK